MDAEKGTIFSADDVVGTPLQEKSHEDFEEYLVKDSFVPAHPHGEQLHHQQRAQPLAVECAPRQQCQHRRQRDPGHHQRPVAGVVAQDA